MNEYLAPRFIRQIYPPEVWRASGGFTWGFFFAALAQVHAPNRKTSKPN
jgi:hypothetical protein